jgi:hypothetical protein
MANNLAKYEHLQPYLQLAHNLIHTYHPSHIGFKVKDFIQALSKIYIHTYIPSLIHIDKIIHEIFSQYPPFHK